jgi:hypothetical protein
MDFVFFFDALEDFWIFVLFLVEHDVLVKKYLIHIFHLFQVDFSFFFLSFIFILFLVDHISVVKMVREVG